MDEARLVSRPAELTGWLSPAEGAPPEALDRARRLLTEALLNSQSEPMEDPSGSSSVNSPFMDPLGKDLEQVRALRTSPLTPGPAICLDV